MDAPIDYHEC